MPKFPPILPRNITTAGNGERISSFAQPIYTLLVSTCTSRFNVKSSEFTTQRIDVFYTLTKSYCPSTECTDSSKDSVVFSAGYKRNLYT